MESRPLATLVRRRFAYLAPSDSVLEAEAMMRMARLRALPVVEQGELLGVLSYASLARRCFAKDGGGEEALGERKVTALMEAKPVLVSADLTAEDAVGRLVASRDGCMAVVEPGGRRLLGILTETDLLRAAYAPAGSDPEPGAGAAADRTSRRSTG